MPVTIEGTVYYQFPAAVVEDGNCKRVPNAVAAVLASPTGAPLTVRDLTGAISGLMTNEEGTLPGFLAPQLAPVTIDMGAAKLPLASLEVGNLVLDVEASRVAAQDAAASAAASAASAASATPGGGSFEPLRSVNVKSNVHGFSLVGDAVELHDIAVTAGSNQFTSASASFTSADIGKALAFAQAGTSGGALSSSPSGAVRTIGSVIDGQTATFTDPLNGTAGTTVVGPRTVTASISRGSKQLTAASGAFTASDVGKTIVIIGAYGREMPTSRTPSASMTSGSPTLTSAYACFTTADVGRYVKVARAGVASAPLVAKIASRTSATVVVLDATASTTVATAEVFDLGAPESYTTRICAVTSATEVTVRRTVDFTVVGVSAAISGGSMVYGTNNSTLMNSLISAVPAGSVLFWPAGQFFLAAGTTPISKPLVMEGADRNLSVLHSGVGARLVVGASGVSWRRMTLRTLPANSSAAFSSVVTATFSDWLFEDVRFHRTAARFDRPGRVSDAGVVSATGNGPASRLRLRRVLVDDTRNHGVVASGVDLLEMDDVRVEAAGRSADQVGVKIDGGDRPRITQLVTCLGFGDGVDLYDSRSPSLTDFLSYMNGASGLEVKWTSAQNYNNSERLRIVNAEGSHNWGHGLALSHNAIIGSTLRALGNGADGIKVNAGATGTPVAAREIALTGLEGSSNAGSGLVISAREVTVNGAVLRGNTAFGVSNGGPSGMHFIAVRAFDNGTAGIYHPTAVTDVRQDGCSTQDANGQYQAQSAASRVLVNNYGEEAAATGAQPTLAFWPVGAVVRNSTDGTFWRRTLTAWAAGTAA